MADAPAPLACLAVYARIMRKGVSQVRRRQLLAVIAIWLLGLSGFLGPYSGGAAAGASGQAPERQASGTDGLLRDAQSYALTYGVSVPEALNRLQLQDAIGALNAELAAEEPNTFAGLRIVHAPAYQVVVEFTQDGADTLRRHARGPLATLAVAQQAPLTLVQRQAIQDAEVREARARGIAFPGREEVAIYGGRYLSTCTSGFTVTNAAGLRGITTAAHCGDAQSIDAAEGGGTALTFQAQLYGSGNDWQWHTLTGATTPNLIVDSDAGTTRSITATKLWANINVGDFACKYGTRGGYHCGTVTNKNWCFTQSDGTTGCKFVFVAPNTSGEILSTGGDSGGPWFTGNTALGSHSLGYDLQGSAFTVIDYITGINVTIATSDAPSASTAPAAPTGLTVTAARKAGTIDLSWTASAGATSYNVKRATVTGGPYTTIATGVTATTFRNTGLTSGVTYFYVVSAVNAVGESPNSSQGSATAR